MDTSRVLLGRGIGLPVMVQKLLLETSVLAPLFLFVISKGSEAPLVKPEDTDGRSNPMNIHVYFYR